MTLDLTKILITALVCVTSLECVNLIFIGIDGSVLAIVVGSICAVIGAVVKTIQSKTKKTE